MATTTAASPWSWSQWRKARASVLPARDVSAWRRGLPPALGHQPDEAAVVGERRDRVDVLVIAAPAVLVFHPVVHPRVRRRICRLEKLFGQVDGLVQEAAMRFTYFVPGSSGSPATLLPSDTRARRPLAW